MTTAPDWARLAAAVRAARGPRTQKSITDAGGPSDTTIGKIEANEWRPTRGVNDTLNKLDNGLGWEPGSAARILAGGEPSLRRGNLGRGLASLIPADRAPRDNESEFPSPPPRPRGSREEWIRKGEQLAHTVPVSPASDGLKRRREAAARALKKTFGRSAEPTPEMLRMMRELLEERELDSLVDRIEKLSRPLQLEVSSYVDDLLSWYGEGVTPSPEDPLVDLDPEFWPSVDEEASDSGASDVSPPVESADESLVHDLKSGLREMADRVEANPEEFGLAARTERDPKEDPEE